MELCVVAGDSPAPSWKNSRVLRALKTFLSVESHAGEGTRATRKNRYNRSHHTPKKGTQAIMDVITQIQEIQAREILDSRGNPTVEAEVTCRRNQGTRGRPQRSLDGRA
jgi:hypothetical protein